MGAGGKRETGLNPVLSRNCEPDESHTQPLRDREGMATRTMASQDTFSAVELYEDRGTPFHVQ